MKKKKKKKKQMEATIVKFNRTGEEQPANILTRSPSHIKMVALIPYLAPPFQYLYLVKKSW